MSYCRWSSDDWSSDIYCWGDVDGGIHVCVAGARYKFKEPLPPQVSLDDVDAFVVRENRVSEMLRSAELIPIGLPLDGELFKEPDEESALKRLEQLRQVGYNVPQHAIDALKAEITDKEVKKT